MIGETLSHDRILGKLGGGGMGIVCEAEDLSLRRDMALELLQEAPGPIESGSGAQELERETHTTAPARA